MRKLALLIGIFAAFGLVTPIANFVETLHRLSAPSIVLTLVKIGATAFVSAVAGVGLLFFFALYRDRGMLHVSRRLRFLGRGAALLLGILLAVNLPKRISGLMNDWAEARKLDWWGGAASSWNALQDPYSMASITNVVNIIQIALSMALLIALSRNPTDEPSKKIPVGRLLRVVSEMTAKMGGLVLIFRLIGLLLLPYSYSVARPYVYESGRTPPPLMDLLLPQIRTLLLQFCGFVAPLIVYRASRGAPQPDPLSRMSTQRIPKSLASKYSCADSAAEGVKIQIRVLAASNSNRVSYSRLHPLQPSPSSPSSPSSFHWASIRQPPWCRPGRLCRDPQQRSRARRLLKLYLTNLAGHPNDRANLPRPSTCL